MHPALSNDKLLLNELIREYLDFSGYRNTLSVFLTGAIHHVTTSLGP